MKNNNFLVSYWLVLCVAFLGFACDSTDSVKSASVQATPTNAAGYNTNVAKGEKAIQIIPRAGASGSFNSISVPAAGGIHATASRIFRLDGSVLLSTLVPAWYVQSAVFLTSTRTAGTVNPANPTGSNTPCAYFDTSNADNNPDTSGFYTIDGFNPSIAVAGTDIDQCAGTAAAEQNQLGFYIQTDRRFMNTSDKLQIIVKAKPINAPNTAPTATACTVAGTFDAANCTNQLFSISMRTSPGASTTPFYLLFPSAKALDLISESILIPMHLDYSLTTVSIDRIKGGAVLYGITVIRLE